MAKSISKSASPVLSTNITIHPSSASAPAALLASAVVDYGFFVMSGFDIWEDPKSGHPFVTLPRRTYVVKGVRKSFDFLRPSETHPEFLAALKARIIVAYHDSEHSKARPAVAEEELG
jgi:hypothetical protein